MQFIDLSMIAHFVAGSAKAEEASHSPFDDNFRTWGTSLEAIVELILQGPQLDMARLPGVGRPIAHACMERTICFGYTLASNRQPPPDDRVVHHRAACDPYDDHNGTPVPYDDLAHALYAPEDIGGCLP